MISRSSVKKKKKMLNWNSILRQSFLELFGLLGGMLILTFLLYNAVHSPALENIVVFLLEMFVGNPNNNKHGGPPGGGIEQLILTPISILRHVTQRALEDSGSLWLATAIFAVAFVGAAIDFVAGNFCRQLAVAVGVRLDAIEQLNPEWDAAAANAGTKGSTGDTKPPPINLINGDQQQHARNNPSHVLDADSVQKFHNAKPMGKVAGKSKR